MLNRSGINAVNKDVLVVEDAAADLPALISVVKAAGKSYDIANTVPDAFGYLEKHEYARIFLDVIIGENPHGAKLVLERIKSLHRHSKVLIISQAGESMAVQRLKVDYIGIVHDVIPKQNVFEMLPIITQFLGVKSVDVDSMGSDRKKRDVHDVESSRGLQPASRILFSVLLLFAALLTYVVGSWTMTQYPASKLGYTVLMIVVVVTIVAALGVAVGGANTSRALNFVLKLYPRRKPPSS